MPVMPIDTRHYETATEVDPDSSTQYSSLAVVIGDVVHLVTVNHWLGTVETPSVTVFSALVGARLETRESLHDLLRLLGV